MDANVTFYQMGIECENNKMLWRRMNDRASRPIKEIGEIIGYTCICMVSAMGNLKAKTSFVH